MRFLYTILVTCYTLYEIKRKEIEQDQDDVVTLVVVWNQETRHSIQNKFESKQTLNTLGPESRITITLVVSLALDRPT